jgi:hypothetical protein
MGGRTVQKYMEFPLLAPFVKPLQQPTEETSGGTGIGIGIGMGASAGGIAMKGGPTGSVRGFGGTSAPAAAAAAAVRSSPPSLQPPLPQQLQRGAKFDLRVWVLLTACSSHKLEAHIFTQVYGRRCSAQYSSDVSRLHDRYVHLTNYSVQKKQKFGVAATASSSNCGSSSNAAAVGTGAVPGIPSLATKLRSTINHTRTTELSGGGRKESGTREQGKTTNSSEGGLVSERNGNGIGDEEEEEEVVDENSDDELDWEECSEKVVGRANVNTPSEVNDNASSGSGSNSFIKRKKKKFGHSQSGSANKSARAVLTEAELLMCKSVPVLLVNVAI